MNASHMIVDNHLVFDYNYTLYGDNKLSLFQMFQVTEHPFQLKLNLKSRENANRIPTITLKELALASHDINSVQSNCCGLNLN